MFLLSAFTVDVFGGEEIRDHVFWSCSVVFVPVLQLHRHVSIVEGGKHQRQPAWGVRGRGADGGDCRGYRRRPAHPGQGGPQPCCHPQSQLYPTLCPGQYAWVVIRLSKCTNIPVYTDTWFVYSSKVCIVNLSSQECCMNNKFLTELNPELKLYCRRWPIDLSKYWHRCSFSPDLSRQ